ncbi:MAG: ribose ABC transporter permease [Anaerolineae bacterium]|nr:ribose ABC transporter permease [Anaerolineae bacterium]NIQ80307.1 ribose ABC transporter permease [Anaerolineae bacterium]
METARVADEVSKARRHGQSLRRLLGRRAGEVTLVLVCLCAAGAIYLINPAFASLYNLQTVARSVAVFGIIAIGETLVIMTAGIDLSPGSVVALTGVVLALMLRGGVHPVLATALTLGAGAVIGLLHGLAVTKIGMNPFIVTLGTLSIARGVALTITRGIPVKDLPQSFSVVGRGFVFETVPIPAVVAALVVIYGFFILDLMPLGRHIRAVGGNREAARLAGIPVDNVLMFVYIQAPVLFSIASILLVSRLGEGFPSVGHGYEFKAITASVLGGTSLFGGVGSVLGAVLGAILMALVDDGLILAKASPFITDIVMGSAVVLAVTIDILRQRETR